MSAEAEVTKLRGELWRTKEEFQQMRSLLNTLMGQGLQDLMSGHGSQRYADSRLKLISGSNRYGYTLNPIGHVGELGATAIDFLFFQNGRFIPSTVLPSF